jgi:hypothetical protein
MHLAAAFFFLYFGRPDICRAAESKCEHDVAVEAGACSIARHYDDKHGGMYNLFLLPLVQFRQLSTLPARVSSHFLFCSSRVSTCKIQVDNQHN